MTKSTDKLKQARDALYDAIDDTRTGMLSVGTTAEHPQPMTAFLDRDSGEIHFVASRSSDLVRSLTGEMPAQFTLVGEAEKVFASVKGTLASVQNPDRLEEIWSPVLSAWFKGGKDDPDVALLCFAPNEAAVWEQTGSSVRFAYEIAKANLDDDKMPDIGTHTVLNFPVAA